MISKKAVIVFGEVLFDRFNSGEEILGGAPFNVAWHLQAFGDNPQFISRLGQDDAGQKIREVMNQWGMGSQQVQTDATHPTGRVDINIIDDEPHYDIVSDMAYDFIEPLDSQFMITKGILYHGSLALRQPQSRHAFEMLSERSGLSIFVDVNLRTPWWHKNEIEGYLHRARWAKLNHDELATIGIENTDIDQAAKQLQVHYNLDQVIITQGAAGALVCTKQHDIIRVEPPTVNHFIDTVGAGDAFSARYIHGLLAGEAISDIIDAAQKFAIKIIGLRGATPSEPSFYQQ
ncbi:MAG: fructokinase [Methylophagaceae bacterium]|jgi:fructokinase